MADDLIDQLRLEISANADSKQATNITKLDTALKSLLETVSKSENLSKLDTISKKLKGFNAIDVGASKAVNNISKGLERLNSINFSGFANKTQAIANGLLPLQNISIGFAGLAEFGKGINALSNGLAKIEKLNIQTITKNIQELVVAITPLTNEMLRGGTAAGNYANALTGINAVVRPLKDANTQAKALSFSLAKVYGILYSFRKVTKFLGDAFTASANYIENLNLFIVTFGRDYQKTLDWSLNLASNLGLSSNELVKMTGLFKQLSTAIGISDDMGTEMAKTMTQLALDFSSFYNLDIAQAQAALQSMIISGQTKPGRTAFGIETAQQQIDNILKTNEAFREFGVTSKVLLQSDKAMLRLIATLEAGSNAFGDMGNTITSSKNQLRIFTASIDNLKIAIGDAIEKPLTRALIYINGFIIGLTNIIRAFIPLKNELSYGLPEGNLLGEATEEADALNASLGLLSFDKFESLSKADVGITGDLTITEAISAELAKQQAAYNEIFEASQNIANKATKIGNAISNWFIIRDENNNFVAWTNNAIALVSAIETLIALKIVTFFASYIAGLNGATLATAALQAATFLLRTAGIFMIIYAINQLVSNWDTLSGSMKAAYFALIALGVAFVAFSLMSKTQLLGALFAAIIQFNILKTSIAQCWIVFAIGIAVIAGIMYAIDDLSPAIRIAIGILMTLIGVVIAATVAWAAFHATMSLGVAVPLILLGVAAAVGGIMSIVGAASNTQYFARGGVVDTRGGANIVIDEYNKPELIHENKRGQVQISNQESLRGAFLEALRQHDDEKDDSQNEVVINIPRPMSSRDVVMFTYADFEREIRNRGGKIVYGK